MNRLASLEHYLQYHAQHQPDKVAVVVDDHETTYGQLWQMVEERAAAIKSTGLQKGAVVAFRTTQTLDFLVEYHAIHWAGGVALPLERDMPEGRFCEVVKRYEDFTAPDDVADILFTTGTTGDSKGVMVSNRAIIADAENLIDRIGFTPELTFIICGPLNHIGSLSKIFPVVVQGATLYILEGVKDLGKLFHAMDYPCPKVATFMVPATVRILLQLAKKQLASYADKIDFIESGGAPLPPSDMQELCATLPKSRLYNTYASTETGIVCSYNYNDGICLPGCLGNHMKNSEAFITPEGRVACKGETLMTGYANDPERTNEILRDGIVYMADNGEIDAEGRLFLQGRNDDVINIGGYKVTPTEVEDAALSFDGVKDCICISASVPAMGTVLKLLYVAKDGMAIDKRSLAKHIAGQIEAYKVPMRYEQVDSIARTYNGKLNRKYYRQ